MTDELITRIETARAPGSGAKKSTKKGLHYCSRCGRRSYHKESVLQHIRDLHGGEGEALKEPTRSEMMKRILSDAATIEAQAARIEELERHKDDWRSNFRALEKAIVGETGLSAMTVAAQARKYRPLYEDAIARLAAYQSTPSPSDPVRDAAGEAEFTEWFVKNYPGPDTIIHDPHWHAPRVFRAAKFAISLSATADLAIRRAEGGQG